MPVRVQLSRKKGWRMPENTVKVARPSRWGNPFLADELGLDRCIDMFRDTLRGFFSPSKVADLSDDQFRVMYDRLTAWKRRIGYHPGDAVRSELRGANLACFCPLDAPCHADVLLELANTPTQPESDR